MKKLKMFSAHSLLVIPFALMPSFSLAQEESESYQAPMQAYEEEKAREAKREAIEESLAEQRQAYYEATEGYKKSEQAEDENVDLFNRLFDNYPALSAGDLRLQKKDYEGAIAAFDRQISASRNPQDLGNFYAHYYRGIAYFDQEYYEQSEPDFAHCLQSIFHIWHEDLEYIGVTRHDVKNNLYAYMALNKTRLGDWNGAMTVLNDQIAAAPGDAEAYGIRAMCLVALKDYATALRDINVSLSLESTPSRLTSRAIINYLSKNKPQGDTDLGNAFRLGGNSGGKGAYDALMSLPIKVFRYQINDLDLVNLGLTKLKAAEGSPFLDKYRNYSLQAWHYGILNNFQEAKNYVDKASALSTKKSREFESARRLIDRAEDKNRYAVNGAKALDVYQQGQKLFKQSDFCGAGNRFKEATLLYPDVKDALMFGFVSYYRCGEYNTAAEFLYKMNVAGAKNPSNKSVSFSTVQYLQSMIFLVNWGTEKTPKQVEENNLAALSSLTYILQQMKITDSLRWRALIKRGIVQHIKGDDQAGVTDFKEAFDMFAVQKQKEYYSFLTQEIYFLKTTNSSLLKKGLESAKKAVTMDNTVLNNTALAYFLYKLNIDEYKKYAMAAIQLAKKDGYDYSAQVSMYLK